MAWKKVIVSGSNAELAQVTASEGINLSSPVDIGGSSYNILVLDSSGDVKKIAAGSISGTDTTYTISASNENNPSITLKDGDATTVSTIGLEGSTGIEISSDGTDITISSNLTNTNTTYDAGVGLSLDSNATFSVNADQGHVTTVGALSGGSIASGFGTIDIGSDITTTGTISAASASFANLTVTGSTTLEGSLIFNGLEFTEEAVATHSGSHEWGSDNTNTHEFTGSISATGNISASSFSGDGSGLTNINPANVSIQVLDDGYGINTFSYDGGTAKTISVDPYTGITVDSNGVSVTPGGVTAAMIDDDAITNAKIAAGAITSGKLANNIIEGLTQGYSFTSANLIMVSDASGTNLEKATLAELTTYFDGALSFPTNSDTTYGLTAEGSNSSNPTIILTPSGGGATSSIQLSGTTNEIEVKSADTGNIAVSLPTDVTMENLTVTGILTAESVVTINSNNVTIDDQYISLGESAGANVNTGIIFGANSNGTTQDGVALMWDPDGANGGRLKVEHAVAGNDNPSSSDYSIPTVFSGTSGDATTNKCDHVGNIRVESNEIYIYV